ncbi:uncharacterized protein LOC131214090 [Anopheles bellator]|uniref:uncharacterized protein LOC131214090 n=1 Tax=Anopheles bellator TaxID=139047 RepID=UPI002649E881|nr:uncharacterized protein LOC131214090 [Anopheles bellator]
MLLLALRSLFFVTILLGYSTGIWRLINDYFRREFETFLQEEAKVNKYLLQDPPQPSAPVPVASSITPLPPGVSIRAADVVAVTSPEVEPARPVGVSGVIHEAEANEQEWLRYWMRRRAATDTPPPSDSESEPQFCSAPMAPPHHGLPPEPEAGMVVPGAGC